jgi:hypothetical protein
MACTVPPDRLAVSLVSFDPPTTQPVEKVPNCCYKGSEYLRWCQRDGVDGPDQDGWCLTLGSAGHGDVSLFRENVSVCPWCGKDLP